MVDENKKIKNSEEIAEKITSDLLNETELEIKEILKEVENIKKSEN